MSYYDHVVTTRDAEVWFVPGGGYFLQENDALAASKDLGRDDGELYAPERKTVDIVCFGDGNKSYSEIFILGAKLKKEYIPMAERRAAALAKLTEEDIDVLTATGGLTP